MNIRRLLRKRLFNFAYFMELILKENDIEKGKKGWKNLPLYDLFFQLSRHRDKMLINIHEYAKDPIRKKFLLNGIIHESGDIANICMMIYDNCMDEVEK